jgi:hypothetical protein
MVCQAGKGWSGVADLKKQQEGKCSAGYVAPSNSNSTNSTQTDDKNKKANSFDSKNKNGSIGSEPFSLLVATSFIFYVVLHNPT